MSRRAGSRHIGSLDVTRGMSSLRNVILALIVLLVPAVARVVRAQALAVKKMDYVLAARTVGASTWRIIFRHYFHWFYHG